MDELQIALLGIGFLIVLVVIVFNRVQEKKFKHHMEQHFRLKHEDILLGEFERTGKAGGRHDPAAAPAVASPQAEAPGPEIRPHFALEEASHLPQPMRIEDDLDYVALLHAARPLDGGQLLDVIRQFSHSGKPSRWLYWDPQACEWRTLDDMQHDRQYLELAATLQLADRRGAVEEQEMLHFCEALHGIITHLALTAEFPDRDAALARAARLDELGSMVDVQVGLNILAPKGMQFAFNRIADFAEKHGLSLAEDGTFVFSDGSDRLQYCLANLESARFSKTNLASGATQGVTLLMDIPKVTNGVAVFDQLTELGRKLAQTLGGSLVDDNHRPIDDAAIEKIKSQLSGIYSRMDNFPLHAGSTKALRLFS